MNAAPKGEEATAKPTRINCSSVVAGALVLPQYGNAPEVFVYACK